MLAYQLIEADGYPWWLLLIPAPLVVFSFWFGPVTLLLARIRREKVFYALTDNRLLVRDGLLSAQLETYPLSEVIEWKQKSFGKQLVSLRVLLKNHQSIVLHCLEQPENLLGPLQRAVKMPATEGDSV